METCELAQWDYYNWAIEEEEPLTPCVTMPTFKGTFDYVLSDSGQDVEIRRAGSAIATTKALPREKEPCIEFASETDIQAGDEIFMVLSHKAYLVERVERYVVGNVLIKLKAFYGEKRMPGRGHTINIGTAIGSPVMIDSKNANQSVVYRAEAIPDLKVILRGLLDAIDELGLNNPVKEEIKDDAEFIRKKLESGKAEPGLIHECLIAIRKKLIDSAMSATAATVVTQTKHYTALITDYLSKWFGVGG